jgi:DNA-binding PadR family transcriptional regulator
MYGQHHHGHGNGPHPGCGQHRRRGLLRTWVFSILKQAPKNGAEIVNQIETITQGNWRPSPGSIYPLLEELTKDGSITKLEDGRYEITVNGKLEFEWPYELHTRQPGSVEGSIEEMNSHIAYIEDVKRIDPSKIAANIDKLRNTRERLSTIIDTP